MKYDNFSITEENCKFNIFDRNVYISIKRKLYIFYNYVLTFYQINFNREQFDVRYERKTSCYRKKYNDLQESHSCWSSGKIAIKIWKLFCVFCDTREDNTALLSRVCTIVIMQLKRGSDMMRVRLTSAA